MTRSCVIVAAALVFAGCGGGARRAEARSRIVRITLTDAGCPASLELPSGPTAFVVSNHGGEAISAIQIWDGDDILGEIENLAPGHSGEFSLTLSPGTYRTVCPGGTRFPRGRLTVAGS